ncbi:MAG: alpha/beta hydrolase family protein [Brachymonas sp.]
MGCCIAVQAKIVQQTDAVQANVVDAYGKPASAQLKLTYVFDEATPSPRPIAVINHGRSYKAESRAAVDPARSYAANARWLAQAGFFVVIPTRIGYGQTGGDDVENSGDCQRKIYPPGYEAAAQQTIQVLAHVRSRSDVNRERTLILGQSYGGTTAMALAAKNPSGVQAFINFAGGGGGNPETQPMRPCGTAVLERMFANYGKTAQWPTLWVYTENDQYMGPKFPKEWFDAFVASGGKGEYVLYSPHGADGHGLFTSSPSTWKSRVTQFLQTNGFADMRWRKLSAASASATAPEQFLNETFRENYLLTGFAAISDIAAPPGLNDACRKRYEEWLKNPLPRGFAIAADRGCGFSAATKATAADLPTDPAERALMVCQRVRDRICRLYAIDDHVVWTKP